LKTIFKLTVAALFCFYIFISCENTDCITFSTRIVIVDFLDSATGSPESREFEIITATESSVIFYGDTSLSKLYLPVNTEKDQTTFIFYNPDNSIDTLEVGYIRKERLISEDCGFEIQFKNIEIIYSTFGNVISLENELSRLYDENIKIYL